MSWTDPQAHVYAVSEVVTAATLNTYVKDNLLFLYGPPAARVYKSAAQAIPDTTVTPISFDTARKNVGSMWSAGSRVTVAVAGFYAIKGCVEWQVSTVGLRQTSIRLNGTDIIASTEQTAPGTGGFCIQNVTCDWQAAVNDYFELVVSQTSGGSLNATTTAKYAPEFSVRFATS